MALVTLVSRDSTPLAQPHSPLVLCSACHPRLHGRNQVRRTGYVWKDKKSAGSCTPASGRWPDSGIIAMAEAPRCRRPTRPHRALLPVELMDPAFIVFIEELKKAFDCAMQRTLLQLLPLTPSAASLAWAVPCLFTAVLATAPLHCPRGSEGRHQLTNVFKALALGVTHLRQRYERAASAATTSTASAPLHAPELHELVHRDSLQRIAPDGFELKLTGHDKHVGLFYGKMTPVASTVEALPSGASSSSASSSCLAGSSSSSGGNVVVKFSSTYGDAVHHAAAKSGCAPTLHTCRDIGGWKAVVTDRVPDDWTRLDKVASDKVAALASVEAAYKLAFRPAGGPRLVHGDARGPNTFVRKAALPAAGAASAAEAAPAAAHAGFDVQFVDFEFSGERGHARYPPLVSTEAFAPVLEAAKAELEHSLEGRVIRQRYDLALIRAA